MARPNRLVVPGVPMHIIQRGNNRSRCFFTAWDFEQYRDALLDASQRYRCVIHAYVLMTNHAHLLVTPDDEVGPSRMMQKVGRRFVRSLNLRRDRTGTLWEGRFKSSVIDSERYFLTCSRYIELNPVRAQMVDRPEEYRWSSHRQNAHGEPDALITAHPLYASLGPAPESRRHAYRALFRETLDSGEIAVIRRAANRCVVLGDSSYCERLEASLGRPVARGDHGGDRRSLSYQSTRV